MKKKILIKLFSENFDIFINLKCKIVFCHMINDVYALTYNTRTSIVYLCVLLTVSLHFTTIPNWNIIFETLLGFTKFYHKAVSQPVSQPYLLWQFVVNKENEKYNQNLFMKVDSSKREREREKGLFPWISEYLVMVWLYWNAFALIFKWHSLTLTVIGNEIIHTCLTENVNLACIQKAFKDLLANTLTIPHHTLNKWLMFSLLNFGFLFIVMF